MAAHTVSSDRGEFEVVVAEDGTITDIRGDWPKADEEFTLEGDIPEHASVDNVPESIRARAAETGWEVCYYDDVHCRTCYCDGKGRMRCSSHC
jgi:hypothetical protein